MLRRPALFKQLPHLWWRPAEEQQLVPLHDQSKYPALASDFAVLAQELLPQFRQLDNDAMRMQNQFRRLEIIMILGGILATILGAVQTARAYDAWPGIAEAILTGTLGIVAYVVRERRPQQTYFTSRLKAELLRGEYFLYLGRISPYADVPDPLRQLKRRVAGIVVGEESP